jgi:hypothetical protein
LLFRNIERSSNEALKRTLSLGIWNFWQTLALLQLAARGEDVKTELPRLLGMLASASVLDRVHGWDAVRLVFPVHAERLRGYNPEDSAVACHQRSSATCCPANGK